LTTISGTYQNGHIKLDKEYLSKNPAKVIVTFLEEAETSSETRLSFDDFSFSASRQLLADYKGSFTDALIQERRGAL